jgi:transposase
MSAPQAIQVADRFHLLPNASAALHGRRRGRCLGVDLPPPEPPAASCKPPSASQRYLAARHAARDVERLDAWVAEARTAALKTCVAFAGGIQIDRAAVDVALRLPWPHGPGTGHINRSTLIKCQGCGRATVELLCARVLAA